MTTGQRPAEPPPPQPAYLAGFLSYLVPGLGQISQGRQGKGIMFMVILLGMFFLGQAMGDWRNVYMPPPERDENNPIRKPLLSIYNRWHFAGQFWIGIAAWPAIWQFYDMPVPAKDRNPFWHNFQRAPRNRDEEDELNTFFTNSDKTPDLGWVYTVVAGMLNILVIYDAVMGPAFIVVPRSDGPSSKEPAGQGAASEGAAS
jgi:hypothetical protein